MKALLIADNDKVIENIGTVLKSAGYEIITYRYFLKALDNIEEVSPHLIVISTEDYPRHWKTLAQFSSTNFGGYIPEIILFTGAEFSEDELRKAKALNVRGIFNSIDVEGLDKLRAILLKKSDIYSGTLTEEDIKDKTQYEEETEVPTVADITEEKDILEPDEPDEEEDSFDSPAETEESISPSLTNEDLVREKFDLSYQLEQQETAEIEQSASDKTIIPCTLIIINPVLNSIITGKCRNYDGETLDFTVDFKNFITNIEEQTLLDGSLNAEGKISDVSLKVLSVDGCTIHLKVTKEDEQ